MAHRRTAVSIPPDRPLSTVRTSGPPTADRQKTYADLLCIWQYSAGIFLAAPSGPRWPREVSVETLLKEAANEYLERSALTHAHLYHYQLLGDNLVHGAPVYAAIDTATMLKDVFAAGPADYELSNTVRWGVFRAVGGWRQQPGADSGPCRVYGGMAGGTAQLWDHAVHYDDEALADENVFPTAPPPDLCVSGLTTWLRSHQVRIQSLFHGAVS